MKFLVPQFSYFLSEIRRPKRNLGAFRTYLIFLVRDRPPLLLPSSRSSWILGGARSILLTGLYWTLNDIARQMS